MLGLSEEETRAISVYCLFVLIFIVGCFVFRYYGKWQYCEGRIFEYERQREEIKGLIMDNKIIVIQNQTAPRETKNDYAMPVNRGRRK